MTSRTITTPKAPIPETPAREAQAAKGGCGSCCRVNCALQLLALIALIGTLGFLYTKGQLTRKTGLTSAGVYGVAVLVLFVLNKVVGRKGCGACAKKNE
jgi:hypothetical protein